MGEPADTNAAIWKSAEAVEAWTAEAERQEHSRQSHRRFLTVLLPFGEPDEFTFLDLGAGTGAASRVILDLYPHSTAILADYSAEMMRAGERQRTPLAGPRWDNHVRYIIPLAPQLEFLQSAGFEGIDVYWKKLENVIYGGRRPAAGA